MKSNQQATPQTDALKLAAKLGIPESYEDMEGEIREVSSGTRLALLHAMGFPDRLDPNPVRQRTQPRLEAPRDRKCYFPSSLVEEPVWGIAVQVYELASARNWGMGDFKDVKHICELAAEAGADFVGLNPLHALFLANPKHCSPYSPSNRLFLNPLYLAIDKLPGFTEDLVDQARLSRLRSAGLVDYEAVAECKLAALAKLWRVWKSRQTEEDGQRFEDFRKEGGEALLSHCVFESLSLAMVAKGHGCGWQDWPEEFRSYHSPAVADYAAAHQDDIDFQAWLQWQTTVQLQDLSDHARAVGLRYGLYLDFAVGEVPDGSSTWAAPDLVLSGIHVGAPPDAFSANGQDWGLVPLSPEPLRDRKGSYYETLIDRTARFAGALRIDHALGLWQMFLIPEGEEASAGGYLRYPFTEIVASLASVSQGRRTVIIGEDLGNVPEGFREALQDASILGYKVLYFEDMEAAEPPAPPPALACLSTHDLPPLAGWWRGEDIALSEENGWIEGEAAGRMREERGTRRQGMLRRLEKEKLISSADAADLEEADILVALHRLLGASKSPIVAVRLADMVGESRATNIPGIAEEYPNWRVKLEVLLEELAETPLFRQVAEALRNERPKREEK